MRKRLAASFIFLPLLTVLFTLVLTGGVASAHSTIPAVNVEQNIHNVQPKINTVNCGNRTDFFTIYSSYAPEETCYASAGTAYPNIGNVYLVCSGNNRGLIYYYDYANNRSGSDTFGYNSCRAYTDIYIGTLDIY